MGPKMLYREAACGSAADGTRLWRPAVGLSACGQVNSVGKLGRVEEFLLFGRLCPQAA